jgi:hypothetical protein
MPTPEALACDAQTAQAAAIATPRMVLPIEFRAMPNLLLRVNALCVGRKTFAFALHRH